MAKTLKCDLHDYLEIACMYQYRVEILLDTGVCLEGTPKTTRSEQGREFLIFQLADNTECKIETNTLKTMSVLTNGAKFSTITF